MSGVRDSRCASLLVCAWLQSPRAPALLHSLYTVVALLASVPASFFHFLSLHETAGFGLRAFASLSLASALRLCVSALLSALQFSLLCYSLSSALLVRLCLSLVAHDSNIFNNKSLITAKQI